MLAATFLMALREIQRNLLRSGLTALGIIIGVGSVVALVSIGEGASASIRSSISSLGHNMLTLSPGADRHSSGSASADPFTIEDATAIEREVRGLLAIAPASSTSAMLVLGNKNRRVQVSGTTNSYLQVRNYSLELGREFSPGEVRSGRPVCLIGATTRKELYGGTDPIGTALRVGKSNCEIIGVLAAKGESGMGSDQDDVVLMPLLAFQRRLAGNRNVMMIFLSVQDGRPTSTVKSQLELLMRERRRLRPGAPADFNVRDMQEIATAVQSTSSALTALLGAIAAVSLLVGGIGIMNIMLVSVTERTREIGTRLAIGATQGEVLLQFLVEAVMLSTMGGIFGVVIGIIGSAVASRGLGIPFVLVPHIVAVAFVFSACVGVVFGYLPARKAARLNPIEALRHE